ncbi:MAG TPA: pseudouridine synthase [Bacteroidia bacterium]|nr:pseudouridine synthase [Bacteroidia bacterium]
MYSYYLVYKPYGILSQFTPEGNKQGLSSFLTLPKDCYPVGRLDADSEGLLLITNDKSLNTRLLDPKEKHPRTYLVQVDGDITEEAVEKLRQGVQIKVDGLPFMTGAAKVEKVEEPVLPPRNPPVRFRLTVPTSWIKLVITEGKNRQVRHMTAAVGFPTLRLVRSEIGKLDIGQMIPGDLVEMERGELMRKLGISG